MNMYQRKAAREKLLSEYDKIKPVLERQFSRDILKFVLSPLKPREEDILWALNLIKIRKQRINNITKNV